MLGGAYCEQTNAKTGRTCARLAVERIYGERGTWYACRQHGEQARKAYLEQDLRRALARVEG